MRHGNQKVMLEVARLGVVQGASVGAWAASCKPVERANSAVWLLARQAIAAAETPSADDFKAVDIAQVARERRKRRGEADDT